MSRSGSIKDKLSRKKLAVESFIARSRLHNKDFSIISNNCWGGFAHQFLKQPYRSPFAGIFLFAPDYVRLVEDFESYMKMTPELAGESRYREQLIENNTLNTYPIGMLGDVEIHFMHYKTWAEALEKWNRRTERINWDNLFFKFCDRDLCDETLLRRFDALTFPNKVCFTVRQYPELKSCVCFSCQKDKQFVESEWPVSRKYFDIVGWLNGK